MAKLPEPPSSLSIPPEQRRFRAGTRPCRIYTPGGRFPSRWSDLRFPGPTLSRFDHHDPPPRLQSKGILYAAADATTCLAEVFQGTRMVDRHGGDPWLVVFELARDLVLLDLTGAWPTRVGASMAIHSGPRPRAQRWSRVIHASYPKLDGLLYCSSMHANRQAVALYERAHNAMPEAPVFHRALSDPALLPML